VAVLVVTVAGAGSEQGAELRVSVVAIRRGQDVVAMVVVVVLARVL
jgi:hypothetical protein